MKLVELSCPHCGAQLKIEEGMARAFCMHCGHQLFIDDGRMRVDSKSFRDAGYEFEQGRMQAQAEQQSRADAQAARQDAMMRDRAAMAEEQRKRERHRNSVHRWLLFLAALVIFPWGILTRAGLLAVLLSGAVVVTAIADRRINWFVRLMVIPAMLLVLLVRVVI